MFSDAYRLRTTHGKQRVRVAKPIPDWTHDPPGSEVRLLTESSHRSSGEPITGSLEGIPELQNEKCSL